MAAKKHIHKYHKLPLHDTTVWACGLSDCSHYMPKHLEFMVLGKKSICWGCGEEIVLNMVNMRDNKPCCENCSPNTAEILTLLEEKRKVI